MNRIIAIQKTVTFFLIFAFSSRSAVRSNSLFFNNAVVQRDRKLSIYGTARDGEIVIVEFANQTVSTVRDSEWKVWLRPMKADAIPQTMTIVVANTVIITNILIGDVWVASGQSSRNTCDDKFG
jgi:sialate O-acetylesterase